MLRYCHISYPSLSDDYEFVKELGQGSQAWVDLYRSKHPSHPELVAVKTYELLDFSKDYPKVLSEVSILRKLRNCKHLAGLHSVYESENQVHIVTDFIDGCSLS